MMKLSDVYPINGQAVCVCGNKSFFVGILMVGNNNRIRVLECDKCEHQLAVPFQAQTGRNERKTANA